MLKLFLRCGEGKKYISSLRLFGDSWYCVSLSTAMEGKLLMKKYLYSLKKQLQLTIGNDVRLYLEYALMPLNARFFPGERLYLFPVSV